MRVQVDIDEAAAANTWSDVAILSNYDLANKVLVSWSMPHSNCSPDI